MNKAKTRLYLEKPLFKGARIECVTSQMHYLMNVMRCRMYDCIKIFNGTEGEWLAVVSQISRNELVLEVLELSRPQAEEFGPTLAFVPTKNVNPAFIVQKAIELGARSVVPVHTERSVKHLAKTDKMNIVAREAAEQSERLTVPKVLPPLELSELLELCQQNPEPRLIIGDPRDGKPAREVFSSPGSNDILLVGPEGGLSPEELKYLKQHSFVRFVNLLPNVLRADTAALAMIIAWNLLKS